MAVNEDHLLECLEVAIKAGDSSEKRRRKAMDTAAWKLLDKPWKGLLLVALDKEEAKTEEGNNRSSSRRMRSRGRRSRNSSTEDWIEGVEGLLSSTASPGYRLSAMLVQRARLGSKWSPAWDTKLEGLRDTCLKGVHPVWLKMAKETPLLAEMSMYPKKSVEKVSTEADDTWIESASFDSQDRIALGLWLQQSFPFQLTAEIELAIQNISRGFNSKGKLPILSDSLDSLSGDAVLIRGLCRIGIGDEGAISDLSELSQSQQNIASVAANHLALFNLRRGDLSSWDTCYNAVGADELSEAMRKQAWAEIPDDVELSSKELNKGLELVEDAESQRALSWALLAALMREGKNDDALELISSLNIAQTNRMGLIIELILSENPGEGWSNLVHRVETEIGKFSDDDILLMLETEALPVHLRALAGKEVQERESFVSADLDTLALDVFTQAGDAIQIGTILMKIDGGAATYPHRTILVYHLLPGNADAKLSEWVEEARPKAIEVLAKESSGVLSETSIGLIKLLEGAPADLDGIQRRVAANREAIRAFNQCRQALLKGGDGLVPADRLEKLGASIDNSSLKGVELRLFHAVLDRLRFNRAIRLLEDHRSDHTKMAIDILERLVGKSPRNRIVDGVRQMVLEHDSIAIPAFAEWHRLNASSTSWYQIITASIEESRGHYLNAARSLHKASLDVEFSFENRVRLARRALIAYAHAGKFSEAVQMLESQQALTSALTGLFQLYLRVCDDAQRQQPEAAKRKIMDWIVQTETFTVEGEDGEIIEKQRKIYPSDELDLLFTYPNSRNLPKDLWQGRIRAAITHGVRDNRRSQGSKLESQFRDLLRDQPSVQEVESVAGEAAQLNPTQGLMMFERAMNSGLFANNEMKALLRIQNGIYRLNESKLPIRTRRKLRHLTLKPLILIDTNLLIDAAKERIGWLLSEEGGIEINAHGSFHRTVRYKAEAGMVELSIPKAAEFEFKSMMGNLERVRSLFNDVWIDEAQWNECINEKSAQMVCAEVIKDYSTWKPGANDFEDVEAFEQQTIDFMVEHRDTYWAVVDGKIANSAQSLDNRTEINGEVIYPERGDRDIMRDAAMLAETTHKGIGAVLVASRDSDFWIVRRSLEEVFGFGVVRTARELSQWV